MPDTEVEVEVIMYQSQDINGNEDFALELSPLTVLTSPLDDQGGSVGVKWMLSVRPPDTFPYKAELVVSFDQGPTPFNENNLLPETFNAHATAPAVSGDNSGQNVPSGPVRDDAVGPAEADTQIYKYTIQVTVKSLDESSIIRRLTLDPSVLVRRRRVSHDKGKWKEW
jgi:hypothetical protein